MGTRLSEERREAEADAVAVLSGACPDCGAAATFGFRACPPRPNPAPARAREAREGPSCCSTSIHHAEVTDNVA